MAWYDFFSRFYDRALEPHYREQRRRATEALSLRRDSVVLDLPCGTGQSFPHLVSAVGEGGEVIGIDLSAGMLREARRRIAAQGWNNAHAVLADAREVSLADLEAGCGRRVRPDRLHVFLGMSVFANPDDTFDSLWSLLAPGGTCVVVDVHTDRLSMRGRMVNWTAGADITRRFWEPLERVGQNFSRVELPSKPLHGGRIWLASATKPT
ncbi:MAG: class I SAM-dependent methyltransferase [Polyangiaceae bacterium]|nr:class I SAM-dependent methyltransferase [Polyangiaceae bacterium]